MSNLFSPAGCVRRLCRSLLPALFLLAAAAPAGATLLPHAADDDFLPVRDAFRLTLERDERALVARWAIADGYYLYRAKFRFVLVDGAGQPLATLGDAQFPAGEMKDDEIFGKVEVYHHAVTARLPLRAAPPTGSATLKVTYQGCAEAGLCYAPETEEWPVDFSGMAATGSAPATTDSRTAPTAAAPAANDAGGLAQFLVDASPLRIFFTFLLFGLGLAFTPCVLPMVPILSSIVVGHGRHNTGRAFLLSLTYVLGMATTYTLAGVAVGLLGKALDLQLWLQSPPVLAFFALVFFLLALSMFELYELRLPAFLHNRLHAASGQHGGGELVPVALMGAISALVVSPCISAPLAGTLMYIGSTGNAALGGGALFSLALGMGIPLLLIGTSGGRLLPKSGPWMLDVKTFFGVLLIGVAIVLLGRILPGPVTLGLWALLALVYSVYLGALEPVPDGASGWRRLRRGIGIAMLLCGALLGVGAALGGDDPLQPLAPLRGTAATAAASGNAGAHALFTRVHDAADLRAQLTAAKAAGQPVLLDFYAEWCVACRIMARDVFPQPAVQAALKNYRLLQADVTANTDANIALLREYGVPGLPAFLFFRPDGSEVAGQRILGEQDETAFLGWLGTRIEPNLQGSGQ